MKCPEIKLLISGCLDQDLTPEEKTAFARHLDGCPSCRKEWEGQRTIHNLFASAERFSTPPGFATRLLARIEAQEKRPSFWSFFTFQPVLLRAVEVAFALIILCIGLISGNLLVTGRSVDRPPAIQESFSLELFQAVPPDSISRAYLALAEASHEK